MDTGAPALEVGFQIDTGGSADDLIRLGGTMDAVEARVLADAKRIEAATSSMIDLTGATASITTFGNATSKVARETARELAQVERAGEAMVRQLERQNAAFGKSREELRGMKAEAAALAAEQRGMTELAGRIRAQELALIGREVEAERQRNSVLAERARIEAALERTTGVGRTRATDLGATFSALDARAREEEEAAIRGAARAYEMFEAKAREGARAQREADAARRDAITSADAYAAKLAAEAAAIGKTTDELRDMEVARRAADAEAGGHGEQADRIRAAGAALGQARAEMARAEAEARKLADAERAQTEAAREAARAQAAQESAVHSLRGSIDPLYATQRRLSAELESAVRLYRSGAIGQAEYERSSQALAARLDDVQRAQARAADGLDTAIGDRKLSASELANVMAQLSDIGVSLAGGQNPFLVLIQQGSQLQGLAMQSGLGVAGLTQAIVGLAFVTTPAAAAVEALSAAEAAQAVAQSAATTSGQRAALTAAELAVAKEAETAATLRNAAAEQALALARTEASAAGAGDTAATARLTAAELAAAAAAAELAAMQAAVAAAMTGAAGAANVATAANTQLAAAQAEAAAASQVASASATRALAPWAVGAIGVGAAMGVAAAGFALFVREVNSGVSNEQLTKGLGKVSEQSEVAEKQLEKLKKETITWGDTSSALFEVVGKDIRDGFVADMKAMVGDVKGLLDDMTSYGRIALAGMYAGAVGTKRYLGEISKPGAVVNLVTGGDPDLLKRTYGAAYREADAYLTKLGGRVREEARKNARIRIGNEYGLPDKPDKPKVDRHAETLAREAQAMEAQIANLYRLADAYGVSGAAALIAEARVKAESEAIKKRADVEAMVDRQIRLSIAERVKAGAQATAAMRDEALIQSQVNAEVAGGNTPAREMQQLLRDRMADLPLLAALEAAHTLKGMEGTKAVTAAAAALEAQRAARSRLTEEQKRAQLLQMIDTGTARLADLREELRLVGATEAVRVRSLATLRASREMEGYRGPDADKYIRDQVAIADAQYQLQLQTRAANDALEHQALLLDAVAANATNAARGMADAFGDAGRALGDLGAIFAGHIADQRRLTDARDAQLVLARQMEKAEDRAAAEQRANSLFAVRTATAQVGLYGDMTAAAKGFFDEKSKGYAALTAAEKVFRAVEFALSVRSIAQDAVETGVKIAQTVARTAVRATEAVVNAIASLPFPLNIAAGAATVGALASIGVSVGGAFGGSSRNTLAKANDGTGTVLGDSKAQSESIKRAIDQLREVDTLTSAYAREMTVSLRSIDAQIGGVATAVVRAGDLGPSVRTGFQSDTTGKLLQGIVTGGGLFSKVPVIGGIISGVGSLLGSLFGSSTSVIGSGLAAGPQSLGSILSGGFDAQTYSDVEKKKKFLGITTGKSYSTQYGAADPALEGQFTLLLRSFASAIGAAAGPLGEATGAVEARLAGFVVDIGKIDLKGLTGEQVAEKLSAVFGAAADRMADAAFPGIARFQQVGEGAFETLVRVASTVEAVTVSLDQLGFATRALGLDAKMGIAAQFDSVSAMTSAADSYFKAFYTPAEQNAARLSQLNGVFVRLGVTMPGTLDAFRALVEAQDLTTAAGQEAYATLLQLAPAFADLKGAMDNAKSAADVLAEREGLQRRLLELDGNTAAIRALDLAKLDASNRILQQQVWAIEDAKEAARAAEELRDAWSSVGDSLLDEINRIRGLDTVGGGSFAALLGQFNAATASARGGDIDAAKLLPGLSQSLLRAASDQATSRQELARVQAEIAASLEATRARTASPVAAPTALIVPNGPADLIGQPVDRALLASSAAAATATQPTVDDREAMAAQIEALRQEIAGMRADNNAGHAGTASAAGRAARVLEDVTAANGGDALSVASAA